MSSCVTTKLTLTNHLSEANSDDTTIQKKLSEDEATYATQESSLAEWDLTVFEQLQKSNPKWSPEKKTKPKRIQDISLIRLDSAEEEVPNQRDKHSEQDTDDNWPYESSPCALFGKTKLASMPAKGFAGEFSHGDPEWDDRNSRKNRSGGIKNSSGIKSSGANRRMQAAKQKAAPPASKNDDSEGSDSEYVSESEKSESGSGSEQQSGSEHSESERSATESPRYESDEDVAMKTPAMGKAFQRGAKKPPTLIRGGHQKATPSVVKALKGRGAFSSDDEDDNNFKLDPHAFDSDDDMTPSRSKPKGTAMDSGTYHGSSNKTNNRAEAANLSSSAHISARREGRLKAAQGANDPLKKNFSFDKAMSSADLRAARKANNSFKMGDMNESINALGAKRRQNRKEQFMNNAIKVSPKASGRNLPTRAKSMGSGLGGADADAAAPGGKLKSALKMFSGSAAPGAAQPEKKKYGSTLSALGKFSASTSSEGARACDIRAAIAQQVQRSAAALEPMELKARPRPKIKKSMSLSAPGMVATMQPDGDSPAKDSGGTDGAPGQKPPLRRSKTADERSQSVSKLNSSMSRMSSSSSHEKLARMRKQKMKDVSERSAESGDDMESSSKRRPANIDRRAKSFQQSRSGTSLDNSSGSRSPQRQSSSRRIAESPKISSPGRRRSGSRSPRSPRSPHPYDPSPQKPRGPNVIALLKATEPVTDSEMMQKGNRQMFHALMYRTKMGMNMDRLRRKAEGLDVSSSSNDEDEEEEEDENDRSGSTYGSERSGSRSYGSGSGSE